MPRLGDKHYEYTEEGKAQYKKDKKRLGMAEGTPSLFWATGGEQYEEKDLDPEKPIKTISTQRKEDEKVIFERIAVNTDKTLFKAHIDKDNEKFKYIKTGDATTTVPLKTSHASHVSTHLQNIFETYTLGKALDVVEKFQKVRGKHWSQKQRDKKQEGGVMIEEQMADIMPEEEPLPLETTEEPTETMLPDEEMEDDYIDFVIDEALTTEEEQYLLDRLGGDDQLSMIFDKVVETASEFSGAGSVEGPGNAVSDSIPARLSDGEFVMTSKAANQIGPDNLQGMMEQAEIEADDEEFRRTAQAGGYVQEEEEEEEVVQPIASEKVLPTGRILPESEVSKRAKVNADLLNPRMSLFAS